MKLLFVASTGGHWEELMCLSELAGEYDTVYVTECKNQSEERKEDDTYYLPQINRHEKHFIRNFLRLFRKASSIMKKEKPRAIVTTGALLAYPFCLLAKLKRVKVIYVESFARINDLSMTGRWVYPFADLFFVQWPELLERYPKAKYVGKVF